MRARVMPEIILIVVFAVAMLGQVITAFLDDNNVFDEEDTNDKK